MNHCCKLFIRFDFVCGYVSTNNSNGLLVVFNNNNAIGLSSCIMSITINVSILFYHYMKRFGIEKYSTLRVLIAWIEIMVFDFIYGT